MFIYFENKKKQLQENTVLAEVMKPNAGSTSAINLALGIACTSYARIMIATAILKLNTNCIYADTGDFYIFM